jgi:putative transposase
MTNKTRKAYKSDTSDREWEVVKSLVCIEQTKGRPREVDLREVLDTIFYVEHTGCQWDMLPHDLLPKSTVYDYFVKWDEDSTLDQILALTNRKVRKTKGREESPSLGIIDSQSVKTAHGGDDVGFDGFKKVKGRKRHLITDILGLVLAVTVTAANVPDGQLNVPLSAKAKAEYPRLQTILADGSYGICNYPQKFKEHFGDTLSLEISSKPPNQQGFHILPKRWIVERTNAWNGNSRRLSKDYERTVGHSEAFVKLSAIRRGLRVLSDPS